VSTVTFYVETTTKSSKFLKASIVINQDAHIQAIKDIKLDNIRFRENCKNYLDQWSSGSKKLKRH